MTRLANEDGFSLIEALVALAILGATASVALVIVSSNLDRNARATGRLRAVLAAEAILTRVGLDIPLKIQRTEGKLADGAGWRIEVTPYAEDGLAPEVSAGLLQVEVSVTPKRSTREPVRLKTLRWPEVPL